MNFVIFPMFFASSALYPLWRVREGSPLLYYVCQFNPFTHAVELIRFALYGQINWISLGGGRRLHGGFHDRRDLRLRSVARLQPPRARRRRDMRRRVLLCVLLASPDRPNRGHAADPRYPDWPCVQAKVPEISLAAVWAGPPLDDAADKWKNDAKVSALVPRLGGHGARRSTRRRRRSPNFSPARRRRKPRRASCCSPACSTRSMPQRSSVMNGLERVTRKQREAAERSAPTRCRCKQLQDAPRRPIRPRSKNSAINWYGRRGSSRTGGA